MRVGMLDMNRRCEQTCTRVKDKGLLQHKCWHANLSCTCLLDQEDRKCELLEHQ